MRTTYMSLVSVQLPPRLARSDVERELLERNNKNTKIKKYKYQLIEKGKKSR